MAGLVLAMPLWRASTEAGELSLANQQLRVRLALPSGLLAVRDLRSRVVWRQYVPFLSASGRNLGKVKTCKVSPNNLIRLTDAAGYGQSIEAGVIGHRACCVWRRTTRPSPPSARCSIGYMRSIPRLWS